MEQKKFSELVKSEIQNKNEKLSKIPNIWNTGFDQLVNIIELTTLENNTKVGLSFNPTFQVDDDTKQKVIDLFDKNKILF